MKTKYVSVYEIEYIAYVLATELMSWDEPIPPFGSRFPNILESCINTPFQTFYKKHLYRRLIGKASILFYLMIKNHPFQNGNKRIAVMTLLFFLSKNGKWLNISNELLYRVAVEVAKSKPKSKDYIIRWLETTFAEHLISYSAGKAF